MSSQMSVNPAAVSKAGEAFSEVGTDADNLLNDSLSQLAAIGPFWAPNPGDENSEYTKQFMTVYGPALDSIRQGLEATASGTVDLSRLIAEMGAVYAGTDTGNADLVK
jgi:uncharacterized protein YukE